MNLPRLLRVATEFVYPTTCLHCRKPCDNKLCVECETELQNSIDRPRCIDCAHPLPYANAPCPWCKGHGVYPYDHIAALGLFENVLKDLIHDMKYHHRWTLAEDLADRLCDLPTARSILESADVLVPVPLWRWRQVSRGYNQADVIASHLAHHFHKEIARCVVRSRHTVSQTEFHSGKARVDNVHGAFRLKSTDSIEDRRIVVIDDVMTSGATLKEVGRTLLNAGPANLSAIVLAIADPRGRAFQAI